MMHLVTVDLKQPGVELYVTPTDPGAVADGWQYRLAWTSSVVRRERLAVAVNATLFVTKSATAAWPGDLARSVDTVIADHQLAHASDNNFLLWFDDELTPRLEKQRSASSDTLARARFGVGGEYLLLDQGVVTGTPPDEPEPRVFAGIDSQRKLPFLAAFEHVASVRAAEILAGHGVVDAITLDAGHSATLTLGRGCRHVPAGSCLWETRAVATHLGVRSPPAAE